MHSFGKIAVYVHGQSNKVLVPHVSSVGGAPPGGTLPQSILLLPFWQEIFTTRERKVTRSLGRFRCQARRAGFRWRQRGARAQEENFGPAKKRRLRPFEGQKPPADVLLKKAIKFRRFHPRTLLRREPAPRSRELRVESPGPEQSGSQLLTFDSRLFRPTGLLGAGTTG